MTLQLEPIHRACDQITRQIRDHYRNLTVRFIVHNEGQLTEALGLAAQDLIAHPASDTALHIMRKKRSTEASALLGTAVAKEKVIFGLSTKETALALCTINIDQFKTVKEARRYAYHLAWHAIDAYTYHVEPSARAESSERIVVRRRNAMDIAAANLRADAFSALISVLQDDSEAIRKICEIRGKNAITRQSGNTPEYYPFVISMEATEFAASQLRRQNLSKKKLLPATLQSAHEIGKTFDDILLRQWLGFSQPAQDMAWRGYNRDEILSAAINTSQNTYVRAAGYMISEITGIKPASILDIRESYSPYADEEFNEKLHQKLVSRTFEDIIAEGLKRNSSDPFHELAEKQNQALVEGRVVGWCAAALQSAARGFDAALASGQPPSAAARMEFDSEQKRTKWTTLKSIGKNIIRQTRSGHVISLSSLASLIKDEDGAANIIRSIEKTIKTPAYHKGLQAVKSLHARNEFTLGATPKAVPVGPSFQNVPIFAGPGLGGGRSTAPLRQAPPKEDNTGKSDN
jgi:hypothetical protein